MKIPFIILFAFLLASCTNAEDNTSDNNGNARDYKQEMRDFVIGISKKAKAVDPDFAIIPQNGIELVTNNGDANDSPDTSYLAAIDGNGQEDLFYGYDEDDEATPAEQTAYIRSLLTISKNAGKTLLVTDYTWTASKVADSYQKNVTAGYVSYAAPHRSLDVIPTSEPPGKCKQHYLIRSGKKLFIPHKS